VLYLRISDDPSGREAGIERQRAECLRLAEREGFDVVGEYPDNDRSAYSGKPRPAFEKMLTDAALGGFDVVIVWASDRLYRRVADLTRIAEELTPRARIVAVMAGGDIDLSTSGGDLSGADDGRGGGVRVGAQG
jgi:DNA invertase Pin-like site-specific DNA recombinase